MSYDHKEEVQESIRSVLEQNNFVRMSPGTRGTWEKQAPKPPQAKQKESQMTKDTLMNILFATAFVAAVVLSIMFLNK